MAQSVHNTANHAYWTSQIGSGCCLPGILDFLSYPKPGAHDVERGSELHICANGKKLSGVLVVIEVDDFGVKLDQAKATRYTVPSRHQPHEQVKTRFLRLCRLPSDLESMSRTDRTQDSGRNGQLHRGGKDGIHSLSNGETKLLPEELVPGYGSARLDFNLIANCMYSSAYTLARGNIKDSHSMRYERYSHLTDKAMSRQARKKTLVVMMDERKRSIVENHDWI
nr:hypothetical protein CFP56_52575 [Quercus suber]